MTQLPQLNDLLRKWRSNTATSTHHHHHTSNGRRRVVQTGSSPILIVEQHHDTLLLPSSNNDNNNNYNDNYKSVPERVAAIQIKPEHDSFIATSSNDQTLQSKSHKSKWNPKNLFSRENRLGVPTIKFLWSIQVLIVVVLMLAVLSTGISIWLPNYLVSQSGLRNLSDRATQFSMEHISTNIMKNVDNIHITSGIILHQLEWSRRFHSELAENETLFLGLIRDCLWDTTVVSLMYGEPSGYFIGMENLGYNKTFHVFKSDPDKRILKSYFMNRDTLELIPGFEPDVTNWYVTERPWYTVCAAKKPEWSVYFDVRVPYHRLQVAFSIPVINTTTGELDAVIAGAFDTEEIDKYLVRLRNRRVRKNGSFFNENGLIYIMETSGYLIGTSEGKTNDPSVPTRFRADLHSEERIRKSASEIIKQYGFKIPPANIELSFHIHARGQKQLINAIAFSSGPNTTWWIVNIYPEKDIMGSVVLANKIAVGVSVAALVVYLSFALLLGCAITRPLNHISKDIKKVANMDILKDKKKSRITSSLTLFEIEIMQNSMFQMKRGLTNFQKYMPKELVISILRMNAEIALGVISRKLSVMFVDIKDFTTISEKCPEHLISLTMAFFTEMSDIVMQHSGVIDKYLGDGMMCLFNAPDEVKNHEAQSVRAAIVMLKRLEELNVNWLKEGLPSIEIRVGINTDLCLVGNVGSVNRFDYTALGDPVNVASRLEGLNKRYGTNIIIGQKTYEAVKDEFACRWISYLAMKGKAQPMHVYEVLCKKEEASDLQNQECQLHETLRDIMTSDSIDNAVAMNQMAAICRYLLVLDSCNHSALELHDRILQPSFSRSEIYVMTEK